MDPKNLSRQLAAGGLTIFALTACSATWGGDPNPVVAVPTTEAPVVVEEPEPTPEPTPEPVVIEAPEPDPTTSSSWDSTGYDETIIILTLTWADTPTSERDDICLGWNVLGEDYVIDIVNAGSDFNDDAIRDFFDGEC